MFELIATLILLAPPAIFFLSPIIALVFGFVRISKYNNAKISRAMNPDSYTDEDIKDFKKAIITAFVTALVLGFIVVTIIILLGDEITYM
ncbi:MAG: hypothetical protein IKB36_03855 [Clostridia bacterium]|nr:hypothetical protein [Clostridia bacterium]